MNKEIKIFSTELCFLTLKKNVSTTNSIELLRQVPLDLRVLITTRELRMSSKIYQNSRRRRSITDTIIMASNQFIKRLRQKSRVSRKINMLWSFSHLRRMQQKQRMTEIYNLSIILIRISIS